MGLVGIFRKNKVKQDPFAKNQPGEKISEEIEAPLCSDDSMQILLKLAWIVTFTIDGTVSRKPW